MDVTSALSYQPQQFQFQFARFFAESLPATSLPGYRGWIFAPQALLADRTYRVLDLASGLFFEPETLTRLNHPLWQKHGMALACYASEDSVAHISPLLTDFRCRLIQEECALLRLSERWCHEFLSARTIGSQKLASYPPISHIFASVVRDLYALQSCDFSVLLTAESDTAWVIEEIDSICQRLIKLVGGRAMLLGQMVHLRMLFLLLNRMYLEN